MGKMQPWQSHIPINLCIVQPIVVNHFQENTAIPCTAIMLNPSPVRANASKQTQISRLRRLLSQQNKKCEQKHRYCSDLVGLAMQPAGRVASRFPALFPLPFH